MLTVEAVKSVVEAVESVVVEAVNCCRLLCALDNSSFIEAVESVVKAVNCSRLLCALESSSFVKAVESVVVKVVDLYYVLLKLLIVVGYIMCSREL